MQFTPEQTQIFNFVEKGTGNGIIDAVAGAGKTTTIIECASYIPLDVKILFCAFNKAISEEIAKKFSEKGTHRVKVETIHALGFKILRSHMKGDRQFNIKENKYRQIVYSEESDSTLEEEFERLVRFNNFSSLYPFNEREKFGVKRLIINAKEKLISMVHKYRTTLMKDDLDKFKALVLHYNIFNPREAASPNFEKELQSYFNCLQYYIKKGNEMAENSMIIDFADMLYLPFKWDLRSSERFDFVFVDECQDLSRSQLNIVRLYCHSRSRIFAVGDPRQSIYGFNGADIQSFNNVQKQFSPMEPLTLTTSFRCPQGVIELAKKIRTDITGSKNYFGVVSQLQQYEVISMARPGDLIMCRTKAPLMILVFSFIDKDIKVRIHDDEVDGFIEELKKLFKQEQLQISVNKVSGGFDAIKDDVINRWTWIIEKEADKIADETERNLYQDAELEYLERRVEFLHKKYETWKLRCPTILDVLKEIKKYVSWKDNPITLSTIHRAKGLENKRVFILNYNKLPHFRIGMKDWEMIQEENLKYVALTRALEELYLVNSDDEEELIDEADLFDDYPLID